MKYRQLPGKTFAFPCALFEDRESIDDVQRGTSAIIKEEQKGGHETGGQGVSI